MTALPKIPYFDDECKVPPFDSEDKLLFYFLLGEQQYGADYTRLDIVFALSHLARQLAAPSVRHKYRLKYVFGYLMNTISREFMFALQLDNCWNCMPTQTLLLPWIVFLSVALSKYTWIPSSLLC